MAFLAILTLPFKVVMQYLRGRKAFARAKVKRAVVVGLDGLEPTLVEQFMDAGLLPNLKKLREMGSYQRLGTTWPPLSPVAWSSFTTGTNPGKHNIFDFINRTPDYAPTMSSVRLRARKGGLKLFGLIPLPFGGGTDVIGLRKSKPFWTVLGEAGVFSSILRVPITYPPDKFRGVQLSAMCVPDLRGTLGMFTFYAEQGEDEDMSDGGEGGDKLIVQRNGKGVASYLRGPANPVSVAHEELRIPFSVAPAAKGCDAMLKIEGEEIELRTGEFSEFVPVAFKVSTTAKLRGVARFYLKRLEAPFEMYCSPIQIDPDRPVLPISHPSVYSSYLARTQGTYYTLGLAEDTGALDRNVLDEDAFLKHSYDIQAERETMFFDALSKTRRGAVVCVFDGPDRIQHMFFRFHDGQHPAITDEHQRAAHRDVIRDMYKRMDDLIGRTMAKLDPKSALFVMSDHGFKTFRRCVDLNAWLRDNGYLKLKEGKQVSEKSWLKDIDWENTRAYALGLAGIFINQTGREGKGIVASGDQTKKLVTEICQKLSGLTDPANGETAVLEAVPRSRAYKGPYTENAPDILVGYAEGYRVSWDSATGKAAAEAFSDNLKAWSGDHCVHPRIAPGVLFSNLKFDAATAKCPNPKCCAKVEADQTYCAQCGATTGPNIMDLGPTILELFGVRRPDYMDGKSLLCNE
jgi:predicted AlkP superfamily phosphohydrolase/phosphomutase